MSDITTSADTTPKFLEPWALSLAAFMGTAGVSHFLRPEFFDGVVPRWLPAPRFWTLASGVVEVAGAALALNPSTRRIGTRAMLATLVGVFPANVWAAVDGGYENMEPPGDSAAAAWLRLPVQFVFFAWAWKAIKNAE